MEMKEIGRKRGYPPSHLLHNKDVAIAAASIGGLWLTTSLIWRSDEASGL